MATHSTIAVLNLDGTVSQIYCHWDGYLDHNGVILSAHYSNRKKLDRLIKLGSLSALRKNTGKKVDFDTYARPTEQCIAYHRDRGEDLQINHYDSLADYYANGQEDEYDYLFNDGNWQVKVYGSWFHSIADAISAEENQTA